MRCHVIIKTFPVCLETDSETFGGDYWGQRREGRVKKNKKQELWKTARQVGPRSKVVPANSLADQRRTVTDSLTATLQRVTACSTESCRMELRRCGALKFSLFNCLRRFAPGLFLKVIT